jgi:SAM-dependent methyltransferase
VNQMHLEFLASPQWAEMLETDLLPWVLRAGDLGEDLLEVGPGPGLTTELLCRHVGHVTAVELDPKLAASLEARLGGPSVTVLEGDGTATGLAADRFSAAACFSMLHHMEKSEDQDRLFGELHRVLRPGGVLVAADARDLEPIRQGHLDDVFTPVPPETLPARLEAVGFTDVVLDVQEYQIRFAARKPPLG